MIQESKFTLNSLTPNIQNFTTVRKDRQGGGLLTLIHKSINFSRRPDSPDTLADPHLEELTITAKLGNTYLIITNIYIPPASSCTGGYNPSLDHLMMTMDTLILGDFNAHHCCCLPTPMTLALGGSPMFPLVVHQPASPSIMPAVQSLRWGLSTNPGATMWCVCGCS